MATLPQSWRRGRARAEIIPQGTRFGTLTILSGPYRQPPPARAIYYYSCQCDCGRTCEVQGKNLVHGNTKSCGCTSKARTHGGCGTRLHNIRALMIQRCHNPNYKQFKDYGGRGIFVCPEWREDYVPFRDWAMANGYANDLEIDRKDNDGPYCPENCRFVTRTVQARNKRSNNFIVAFGETKCIYDWAADPRCPVSAPSILQRLRKGWTPERAISTPALLKNGQIAG